MNPIGAKFELEFIDIHLLPIQIKGHLQERGMNYAGTSEFISKEKKI